jgi:hypothetical protein
MAELIDEMTTSDQLYFQDFFEGHIHVFSIADSSKFVCKRCGCDRDNYFRLKDYFNLIFPSFEPVKVRIQRNQKLSGIKNYDILIPVEASGNQTFDVFTIKIIDQDLINRKEVSLMMTW